VPACFGLYRAENICRATTLVFVIAPGFVPWRSRRGGADVGMQSDRLTVAGITLRSDLDLLLKDELTRQRELSGNILKKSGDRTQDLGVQGRNRK
jgi:hypothetical protein